MQDTGHILPNNFGCGLEQRKILDEKIHSGERSFCGVSEEMWGLLDMPFDWFRRNEGCARHRLRIPDFP